MSTVWIAAGVALVLVIGIGVYVALRSSEKASSTKRSNTASSAGDFLPSDRQMLNALKESIDAVKSRTNPPEVFQIRRTPAYSTPRSKAADVCQEYGARLATYAELEKAFNQGAEWCSAGWVSDRETAHYPMQKADPNCGSARGVHTQTVTDPSQGKDVNCFGIKPTQNIKPGDLIWDWNTTRFSQFS